MGRERRRTTTWLVAAALIGLLSLAAWVLRAADGVAQRERGAAIFAGQEFLAGHLPGHEEPLPTLATRCSNCHAGTGSGQAFTRALTASELTTPRVRRGGPPSGFDAGRLCALLRDGTDPAHVIISTTMPRYRISDEQCRALWSYLSAR